MSLSVPAIGEAMGEGGVSRRGRCSAPAGIRFSASKAAELLELPDAAVATALAILAERAVTIFEPATQSWTFAADSVRRVAMHFAELVLLASRAASQPCPRWALDPLFFPVMLELVTELRHCDAQVAR